jgi:hypothetical protein
VGLSNETIDELINDEVGVCLAKDIDPKDFANQIERICNLPAEEYQKMCQTARQRVTHLDWSNVVKSTTDAYHEILKTKPSITKDESDMLTSLVNFFTTGDVRDYLLDAIEDARKTRIADKTLLPRVKVPRSIRSWIRVHSSTWYFSGVTILISVIGYLYMKGQAKRNQ